MADVTPLSVPSVLAGLPTPVMRTQDLTRIYRVHRGLLRGYDEVAALHGITLSLQAGRTLAVVGESGCGKSTLARQLTLMEPATSGRLWIDEVDVATTTATQRAALQRRTQMVFQNPLSSLNPRQTVGVTLEEPLLLNTSASKAQRREQVEAMMEKVGLRPDHLDRYPHMFSGGQRQRIAIARAIMLSPAVVVADEPTSALDVSVQAQILNLLMDLQSSAGVAYVFISHNLAVVELVADEVMVLYRGCVVEAGPKDRVLQEAAHPYTQALRAAAPRLHATTSTAATAASPIHAGEPPSPFERIAGCAFRTRCPQARDVCREVTPSLQVYDGRQVACHLYTEP